MEQDSNKGLLLIFEVLLVWAHRAKYHRHALVVVGDAFLEAVKIEVVLDVVLIYLFSIIEINQGYASYSKVPRQRTRGPRDRRTKRSTLSWTLQSHLRCC